MTRVAGVVAALPAAARSLGARAPLGAAPAALADGTLFCVRGMGGSAAASAASALIAAGAAGLASVGMAGGLDPALRAGDVLLAHSVMSAGRASFATSAPWRERLAEALGGRCRVAAGALLTRAEPVDTVAAKSAAFRQSGAVAVDMESYAVAEIAARHGLPFVAIRVIVDTAADALPKAVTEASRSDRLRPSRLAAGLAAAPWEIAGLIRLALRTRPARARRGAGGRAGRARPPAAPAAGSGSR